MRFSFRLKIALLTATVSAVPLVIAGWQLIDVNAREVESATQSLQLALVAQLALIAAGCVLVVRSASTGAPPRG